MQPNSSSQETLSQLCSFLACHDDPLDVERLKAIVAAASVGLNAVLPYCRFEATQYARNRVMSTSTIEVLILCWHPGQISPIHDHAGSACVVQVLAGTANEITYRRTAQGLLVPVESKSYRTHEIIGSNDTDTHQLGNIDPADSDLITLHCYSPPLENMHRFPLQDTVLKPLLS